MSEIYVNPNNKYKIRAYLSELDEEYELPFSTEHDTVGAIEERGPSIFILIKDFPAIQAEPYILQVNETGIVIDIDTPWPIYAKWASDNIASYKTILNTIATKGFIFVCLIDGTQEPSNHQTLRLRVSNYFTQN